MRRAIVVIVSGLMVLLTCAVFTSCGEVDKPFHENPCSLDSVSLSVNDEPLFVLDDEAMSTMSEGQLEEMNTIVSSLNRAIGDRPELARMLSADMIDGGSNDYVYEGGDSFFRVVGEFAEENFCKAERMFPEVTCDEFYYSTAIGYVITNSRDREPLDVENPFIRFGESDSNLKPITIDPSFDEIMTHGFWVAFFNPMFDKGIDMQKRDYDISAEDKEGIYSVLNERANIDTFVMSHVALIAFANA